jgi:hypothetical protein
MQWTQSHTLALARQGCAHCLGLGLRICPRKAGQPCSCVLRAIFRACFNEFQRCVEIPEHFTAVRIARFQTARSGTGGGSQRNFGYGMPRQEYMADFLLIAKRTLGEGTRRHKLFKYHFLL